MSSFEDERLRILARVSAGELTPQEGSLQIAMAKVRLEGGAPSAAPDDEDDLPRTRQPLPPLPKPPSRLAIMALLAVPFLFVGSLVTVGLAFFLALPAYVFMAFWNGMVVPSAPGTVEIGFFPTLASLVFLSMVSTGLRWRRRMKVFVNAQTSGQGGFGFAGRWPPGGPGPDEGPFRARLGSEDGFREQ